MVLLLAFHCCFGCEIIVKNVGQKPFTYHMSYAGSNDYYKEMNPGDHDNYNCSCLPHDMEIQLPVANYCLQIDNIDIFHFHNDETQCNVHVYRTGSTATTT